MGDSTSPEVIVGIGIDQVVLRRFRAAYERRGERLLERLFTEHERSRCLRRRDPVPELAVRFAAKEATFKAIGTGWRGGVTWKDVEVRNAPSGRPYLRLTGRVREVALRCGARRALVSLTHSAAAAAAEVILLGPEPNPAWGADDRIDTGPEA